MVRCILSPFVRLVYNLKIEGKENIPKGVNFVYAANHVSLLDPPFVSVALDKLIVYMAKKELFEGGCVSWHIKKLGTFAVDREKPSIGTFRTIREVFKTKSWSLGIFPQGGIKNEHKIEKIKKGFAFIAQNAQADIIPVAICGFDGYSKKPFSKHVTVKIGKPISYKLPENEMIYQWAKQICEFTGFENGNEIPVKEDLDKEKISAM
jgi:1-acyl-sn-glycerol-3-phosphate acyltransferase